MRDIVLAAAIDFEGAIGKHCAAVLDAGRLVVFVVLDLVRTSKVMQRFEVGGQGSGQ